MLNQELIQKMFKDTSHIHTEMSGEAAIKYLTNCGKELPDIMLLDVMMPGMSGLEVMPEIRSVLVSPLGLPRLNLTVGLDGRFRWFVFRTTVRVGVSKNPPVPKKTSLHCSSLPCCATTFPALR